MTSRQHLARPGAVLLVGLLLAVVPGCGADADAPSPSNAPPAARCAPLSDLAPLTLGLVASGQLDGLRAFVETGLADEQLTAVLDALLRLIRGLDRPELEALLAVGEGPLLARALPPVRDALAFVAADIEARQPLLSESVRLLRTCDQGALYAAVDSALRDPALPDLLAALADSLRLPLVQDLLSEDLGGALSRPGFTALVCNIVAALIRPGFSVARDITAPLSGIELLPLDSPPLSTLLDALDRLLAPTGPTLPALQGLICCDLYGVTRCDEVTASTPLLNRDPVFTWLLYDLFVSDQIAFDAVLDVVADLGRDPQVVAALAPLSAVLGELVATPDLRRTLISLLVRLLAPEVARELAPELVLLLDANVVPELLAVVRAFAYGCAPEGP